MSDTITDEITYMPAPEDPSWVTWNGINFLAGKPVTVGRDAGIDVPERVEFANTDGTVSTRSVVRPIPMVELARGNPRFAVKLGDAT
jgi:hypothetical protein